MLTEKEDQYTNVSTEFEKVSIEYEKMKTHARKLKDEAMAFAPIRDANGNDLPLKRELDELPESLEDVADALDEAKEKVKTIHDNPEVLRRYDEQKLEIERIRLQLDRLSQSKELKRAELESLRIPWEAKLTSAVEKVNALFSMYMKELGCAGKWSEGILF